MKEITYHYSLKPFKTPGLFNARFGRAALESSCRYSWKMNEQVLGLQGVEFTIRGWGFRVSTRGYRACGVGYSGESFLAASLCFLPKSTRLPALNTDP